MSNDSWYNPAFFYCYRITPSIVRTSSFNYAFVKARAKFEEIGPIEPSKFFSSISIFMAYKIWIISFHLEPYTFFSSISILWHTNLDYFFHLLGELFHDDNEFV